MKILFRTNPVAKAKVILCSGTNPSTIDMPPPIKNWSISPGNKAGISNTRHLLFGSVIVSAYTTVSMKKAAKVKKRCFLRLVGIGLICAQYNFGFRSARS
jgi:hypothetical protein